MRADVNVTEKVRTAYGQEWDGGDVRAAAVRAFLAVLADPEVVAGIAEVLYDYGLYCQECDYEGWDTCWECREVCAGYAGAVVEWLGGEGR